MPRVVPLICRLKVPGSVAGESTLRTLSVPCSGGGGMRVLVIVQTTVPSSGTVTPARLVPLPDSDGGPFVVQAIWDL